MVEWIYTAALLGVMSINFITIKMRVPIFTFAWGVVTFGVAVASLGNENIIFAPWLQIGVIVMGVLSMIAASMNLRG